MSEKVVKIRLTATVAEYNQAMKEAAQHTREFGSEGEKLAQQKEAMQTLGRAGLAMGAALAAGVGAAVAKFAEFDQAMSYVAATGDDARQNMDALRQAALDAGADTVFSAKESANAIEEMAKAGLSAEDILGGGLSGALDLAAAGGLDVADAAGIAATALKVFNLEGEDMSHVADLLAAGAGKAMGDVTDLSQALQQGGQVAAATGLSIEETTATLAAFASQGLLGSDAGTSFKTMLQRLTPQSDEAKTKMEELGISAYDAAGNFVGMASFAGNLKDALKDLTPEQRNSALATMFGSDAVRAANVIYDEGESGIRKWTAAVDDQGYAAETAATRLDNLIGDWEKFTGAMDTAFISMGEGVDGPLRSFVQGLTAIVDGFNSLPAGGKQAVLWISLVTSGVGLVGGAALVAIPKIAALKVAMAELQGAGAATRAGLQRVAAFMTGPYGIAMVAASAAVVGLTIAQDKLRTSTEVFQNVIKNATSVDELFNASDSALPFLSQLGEATKSAEKFKENLDIIANNSFLTGLTLETDQLQGSLQTMGEELAKAAESDAPAAASAFSMLAREMELSKDQQIDLLNSMGPYRDALVKQATAQDVDVTNKEGQIEMSELLAFAMTTATEATDASAESTTTSADAYLSASDEAAGLNDQLLSLIETMNEANGVGQDAVSQNVNYQETLAGVQEHIAAITAGTEGYALGLALNTESGRANMEMLVGLAADSQSAAEAQFALDGSTQGYTDRMAAGREALINSALAMGATQEEAVALADKIYAIPSEKEIQILAETQTAQNALDYWITSNSGREIHVKVLADGAAMQIGSYGVTPGAADGGIYSGGLKAYADSGIDPGIYPYRPNGLIKFAEEYEEAFISLDPSRRARSVGVWQETGRRLGIDDGGTGRGKQFNFTFGDVTAGDEAALAHQVHKVFRRSIAASGMTDSVGD